MAAFEKYKNIRGHVTKRCRLSWLTNGVLVYEPKCGGISANEYSWLMKPNEVLEI
jgi:hypothetical protein